MDGTWETMRVGGGKENKRMFKSVTTSSDGLLS